MKSYDDIKSMLDAELGAAITAHERELLNRHRTGEALASARERYDRFTLHGMIPEDFAEDESDISS
jgi:hypothetical protein